LPSTFHTGKTSAKGDIICKRPQSLESSRTPLDELFLRILKPCYESHSLRIG